jgi:DNA-binding response OmpR family regulator
MANVPGKQKTILVVEDEEALRVFLEQRLRDSGYHTLAATDGEEALEQLRHHDVDLVILDVLMPNKDGLETIVEIKRQAPSLPVFMIAERATKMFDALAAAKKFGADATFHKPINVSQLVSDVEAHFRGKR